MAINYNDLYWKSIDRQRLNFERKVKPMVKSGLRKTLKPFIDSLSSVNSIEDIRERISYIQPGEVQKLYFDIYTLVGSFFAKQTYNKFKSKALNLKNENELDSFWMMQMRLFVETTALDRILDITENTREFIRSALALAVDQGWGIEETVRYIKANDIGMQAYRIARIARTEVIAASNKGSIIGAKTTGLRLNKEWISTRDSRTREAHLSLDGAVVPLDSEFSNGLEYPGDLDAPASEVVNCRCAIGYIPV